MTTMQERFKAGDIVKVNGAGLYCERVEVSFVPTEGPRAVMEQLIITHENGTAYWVPARVCTLQPKL